MSLDAAESFEMKSLLPPPGPLLPLLLVSVLWVPESPLVS